MSIHATIRSNRLRLGISLSELLGTAETGAMLPTPALHLADRPRGGFFAPVR